MACCHGETPRLIQWSYGYLRTDNPIPVDGTADPKDEEGQMNWWLFVDLAVPGVECINYSGSGVDGTSGIERTRTYIRTPITDKPSGVPENSSWRRGGEHLMTESRKGVFGGEFVEIKGHKPELPPAFAGIIKVRRVTAVGVTPHNNITPGLYEMGAASADVRRSEDGNKLKIQLSAPSCELAWDLYRAVLKNDESLRTVAYEKNVTP